MDQYDCNGMDALNTPRRWEIYTLQESKMEASPLNQQTRPSSFRPKIARLYEDLFREGDEDPADSDGFWGEFFLLKPDKIALERQLESLTPEDLLHLQHETQQLFVRAVHQIKAAKAPLDEHALDVRRPVLFPAPKVDTYRFRL